jgi:hypothetical protein
MKRAPLRAVGRRPSRHGIPRPLVRRRAGVLLPGEEGALGSAQPRVASTPKPIDEEERMHARVVRFTDVTTERIAEIVGEIEKSEGPPPGVDSTGFELFVDEAQGTAVFVGYFETEQKMRDASAVFEAMDTSETPGTRASVDLSEVKLQRPFA